MVRTDYDETTAFLGEWGAFQQTVFFLLCVSIIPTGFTSFSFIFLADVPRHRCLVPEQANLTEAWRKAIIPLEVVNGVEEESGCSRYRLDLVMNLSAMEFVPGLDVNLTGLEEEGCVDGWSYSRDVYQSTIVTEFDLVCSERWKQPFTSSVYFLGVLCGSFFSGQISDRFGRKPVLFTTMAVSTVFSFVQIFSPSWLVFSVLFFLVGLGNNSNYMAAFVLGSEVLTGRVRNLFSGLGVCLFFALGFMAMPLFAYFIREWRFLLLALSLPGLAYIPLWWFIPESPRWLLTQGRVEEAEAIVRQAARRNNVEAPHVIFKDIEENPRGQKCTCTAGAHHSFLDLLKTSNIRNTTLILCLVWWTFSMGYYSLSLNTSNLHGDPYVNCFISAAIEVPAYITSWLALRCLPRRMSSASSMLLGAGTLYCMQLLPPSLPQASIALAMLGKYGVAAGMSLMYPYTAELYPTVIRNTAVGFCSMVARVAGAIAPYFVHLGLYYKQLQQILLGTLLVLSALATLLLPESFGRPLPETIQQTNTRERLHFPCVKKKTTPSYVESEGTIYTIFV